MNKLGNNTKTAKAEKFNYENLIMHFSPLKKARTILKAHNVEVLKLLQKRIGGTIDSNLLNEGLKINVCKFAGACAKYCLDTSGHGKFSNVQIARTAKTLHYLMHKPEFLNELEKEVKNAIKRTKKKGLKLAVRLNGTSDLDFTSFISREAVENKDFSEVQFYDYTKDFKRFNRFLSGNLPKNYYLTFSYDRLNHKKVYSYEAMLLTYLERGAKIAIIEDDLKALIAKNPTFGNYAVIDGDDHDLRFLDKNVKGGAMVSLKLKKTK